MIQKTQKLINERIRHKASAIIWIAEVEKIAGDDWESIVESAALRENVSVDHQLKQDGMLIFKRD